MEEFGVLGLTIQGNYVHLKKNPPVFSLKFMPWLPVMLLLLHVDGISHYFFHLMELFMDVAQTHLINWEFQVKYETPLSFLFKFSYSNSLSPTYFVPFR